MVMSARRQPWGKLMDCQRETWDAEDHPQTQTIYYCGNVPHNLMPMAATKVFYFSQYDEELDRVSARTIEAFEKALEFDWDFMARVHSSTYVHKKNLVEHLKTIPRTNVLYGLLTEGGPGKQILWGGGHYIMSRDVIASIVERKANWPLGVMEDQAITRMGELLDIPMGNGVTATINVRTDGSYNCMCYGKAESFDFKDFADIRKAEGQFFFRVKHDPDRSVDLKIMRELKRCLP